MTQPNSNGISRSHHAELFQYFKAPTLNERVAQLSTEAKEHLARLDNERKAAKEAQGLAPTMDTRVAHWWVQEPKVVAPKPVSDLRACHLIVVSHRTSLCLRIDFHNGSQRVPESGFTDCGDNYRRKRRTGRRGRSENFWRGKTGRGRRGRHERR